jgi:hypothetical protein
MAWKAEYLCYSAGVGFFPTWDEARDWLSRMIELTRHADLYQRARNELRELRPNQSWACNDGPRYFSLGPDQ